MTEKQKKNLIRILAALVLFAAVAVIEKAGVIPEKYEILFLFLFLIPYLVSGYDVVRKAVLGVINRQMLDEAFLMVVASIGAFASRQYAEAAAVMIFYQIGEWFQSYAVGRSRKSISDLMDIVPEYANLELEDGTVETIDPDDVEPGNILVIKPGEKIPVDGLVISGESLVNTAALTGEPVPRTVRPGEQIISGCINGEGLLRIQATKMFEDSTVAKILELVETASEKKSKTENFITRFARYYTPAVVAAAVILFAVPSIITGNWHEWLYRACTFLVISCPCALVISVPLAFFGGIGAASKNGVLVKGSNYFEVLSMLDTVVSDKTGTMTEGNFKVSEILTAEGVSRRQLLETAAAAEGMSTHPIANSIREQLTLEFPEDAGKEAGVTETENISGYGLLAVVDGKKVLIGNRKLMERYGVETMAGHDPAATEVYVAREDAGAGSHAADENGAFRFFGTILIRDSVKPEAKNAIRDMKAEGVGRVVMLTGDRKETAAAVAEELGVDKVFGELLPSDKVLKVEELLARLTGKQKLAFIGDGINDAPVLSRADVGIAMGSMGSDAAIEAADVVIMDDDLGRIPAVIRIAKRTVGIAKQNIVFALAVKAAILILGALGIANMWAAVFADVGVAVLCILNSMRLLAVKKTIG